MQTAPIAENIKAPIIVTILDLIIKILGSNMPYKIKRLVPTSAVQWRSFMRRTKQKSPRSIQEGIAHVNLTLFGYGQ